MVFSVVMGERCGGARCREAGAAPPLVWISWALLVLLLVGLLGLLVRPLVC
ncbi:hypothetical protein DFLDMN_000541 [Cupriavidus sp. H19C3]